MLPVVGVGRISLFLTLRGGFTLWVAQKDRNALLGKVYISFNLIGFLLARELKSGSVEIRGPLFSLQAKFNAYELK